MSVRSKFEAASSGSYDRAVSRLRTGAARLMAERAREMQKAANEQAEAAKNQRNQQQRRARASTTPRDGGKNFWPLPGLAPMTRVRTTFGDVHAAALRKGDEVLTRSGDYLPILWLNRICLDEHILAAKPDSNPIVMAAGALGPQIPSTEIMVSPRQVICASQKTGLKRDQEASTLISRPGIRRLRETSLSYTMFHVGQAAEVYCEGAFLLFPIDA